MHQRPKAVLFPVIVQNSGNTARDFIDAVDGVKSTIQAHQDIVALGKNGEGVSILSRPYAQKIPGVIETLFEVFNNVSRDDAKRLDVDDKERLEDALDFLKDRSAMYLSNWKEAHARIDSFIRSNVLP